MVFDVIKGLRLALHIPNVSIENAIFKLHYRFTTILLLVFCAFVTLRQYFGHPIDCMAMPALPSVSKAMIEKYCWSITSVRLSEPGLGNYSEDEYDTGFSQYYQWVYYALFVQAIIFYIPHYLWENLEGGRMKAFIGGITCKVTDRKSREECLEGLRDHFFTNQSQHNLNYYELLFCEVLNFVLTNIQIIMINMCVGGRFSSYYQGYNRFSGSNSIDLESSRAFPRAIKCLYHSVSVSGVHQRTGTTCVLPMNADNEKMYYFLWVWFVILSPLAALAILHRLLSTKVSILRVPFLRLRARSVPPHVIERFSRLASVGDWFFIRVLSKNVDPVVFKEFMVSVARDFDDGKLHDKYELMDCTSQT